jgi:uncharacterized protein (DUF433 family)
MGHTITVSNQVYEGLQREATRNRQSLDTLAERWLTQHLDLERYPELTWREGPGGWRVGIKGTAADVYTVVGYVQAGYSPQEIANEMLPGLALNLVRTALRYYAEYPDEIDRALADNQPEAAKAWLYRTLGPEAYRQMTGSSDAPRVIREAHARYDVPAQPSDEDD